MAHTPGPWIVAGEAGNTGEAFVIESDERTVCWTADSTEEEWEERGGALGTDEDRANARLIAAAPELLEALREAAAIVAHHTPFGGIHARFTDLIERIEGV